MRVVTWNVLSISYIDFTDLQRDYPTIDPSDLRLSKRLPVILRQLKRLDADLVLLQEVTPQVREALQKRFGDQYEVGPLAAHRAKESGGTSSGNVVLLRHGMFGPTKYETKFFGGSQSATGFTFTSWQDKPLVIANVHFDWQNHARRKREARGLLRYLREISQSSVLVVGGDFNSNDDTLHRKFVSFHSLVQRHGSTFLCENPMIDWIYVKGAQSKGGHILNEPVRHRSTCFQRSIRNIGSDHYPVVGEIE